MSSKSTFNREVREFWYPKYNKNGYPHVQQGVIINPERNEEFSPFILMAEDWYKRGIFSDHPHRGFQTVTYVVDGRLEHIDNAGGYSLLDAGDVQYMNAGWAARHAEEAFDDDLIHTLQVWLNLPKSLKQTETSYQNIRVEDAPVVNVDGGSVRVYSGDIAGATGPMKSMVPITMSEITLRGGTDYTHVLPENHNSFLYMLAGEMEFGESKTKIAKTGAATLSFNEEGTASNPSELKIKAVSRSKVLIYSGVPIREEIAFGGPFVMNTQEEIREAFRDLQRGIFGPPAVKK
ncbi:pirin family protein [Cytobacillus sp. IB215316]|uniref:pirin family protein n=1 Tax=Cytobacillus sp. IB215316 TaxID=3097354 RepID=UPI002A149FA4|nr:pirin-like C-terminal cupin domain-containing protein [Cytobacillus sp. IB215316]MDX8362993.1 pirin-like C-terminal cupin domain-containing protein [Cytobacillus sp. IB215316]